MSCKLRVDSICLCLLKHSKEEVLVGLGNQLIFYYQNENQTTEIAAPIILKNKIHGIISQSIELHNNKSFDGDLVVIHGGREIVSLVVNRNEFKIIAQTEIEDWINSANLYNDIGSFSFLTSHNIAQNVSVDFDQRKNVFLEKVWSQDSSTLYCSKIYGENWNSTIIFAGTALGEILIWKPIDGQNCEKRAEILHRLSGHKGVIFSIDVNFDVNLMTTTSDDRSVKFWIIKSLPNHQLNIEPGVSTYGHIARIFNCKIIIDNNKVLVASVGEDSILCLWSESGQLILKKKLNFGAGIWGIEYNQANRTIYTSGSDGNIRSLSLNKIIENPVKEVEFSSLKSGEYISKVHIFNGQSIVGLTNLNRIVFKFRSNGFTTTWYIDNDLEFKPTFLETFENQFAIGGYEHVKVYEFISKDGSTEELHTINIKNCMFRSFHYINKSTFVCCDDKGNCQYYRKNKTKQFTIPKCKERWTTAAFQLDDILIIGDRCGNIHFYKIGTDIVTFQKTLKNVHGNLGITQIVDITNTKTYFRIQTSGHDASIKSIEIDKETFMTHIYHHNKIEVNWIEKFYSNGNIAFGFNDCHFVAWNNNYGIVHEIDCGGGNRFWDIDYNEKLKKFKFVFIRNQKLFESHDLDVSLNDEISNFKFPIITWHVKECNVLKTIKYNNNYIIVSGGGDNIIKLTQYCYTSDRLSDLNCYQNDKIYSHISNIRCLSVHELSNSEYLILSAGGRAQICATKLIFENENIIIKELGSYMLKSSDFERRKLGKTQHVEFDPETRFMCLTINSSKIYTGCSDGYIREYEYAVNDNEFKISLNKTKYYGKCILNITFIEDHNIILTMATDGLICFWDLKLETIIHTLHHHASGVNAWDLIKINNGVFKLFTGGDDQSLTLTKFTIHETNSIEIISTVKSATHHTSQVTGVKFLNENECCSIGIDQVLNVMECNSLRIVSSKFTPVSDVKGVHIINDNNESCVKVAVYGSGVQIITLKNNV